MPNGRHHHRAALVFSYLLTAVARPCFHCWNKKVRGRAPTRNLFVRTCTHNAVMMSDAGDGSDTLALLAGTHSAALIDLPDEAWDDVASGLQTNGGVATIDLPDSLASLHARCFETARAALDVASASSSSSGVRIDVRTIGPNDDASRATGYHGAGSADAAGNSLSRYNAHREGFVFSDGDTFDVPLSESDDGAADGATFRRSMDALFRSMHDLIALNVLQAVCRRLDLPPGDWFQDELGPTSASSQWHVKRYTTPDPEEMAAAVAAEQEMHEEKKDKEDEYEWLPVHTDPSLISIVLHDVPGTNDGAMGLQYQAPNDSPTVDDSNNNNNRKEKKVWKEVPRHGHAIATVFVGSVLSYITGGLFPGAKHRVIYRPSSSARVAATLFVRPRGDALLAVPPSALLTEGGKPVKVRNNTFDAWVARVSRNYMKQKKKGSSGTKQGKDREAKEKDDSVPPPPMVWSDQYTQLSLHPCDPPLQGQEKFLGGELSSLNGKIYTIPGHARRVLEIDPTVEPPVCRQIGPEFKGEFKWLRGIEIGEAIYGIPCHADSIIKIFPKTGEVMTISWDAEAPGAPEVGLQWKWHGGELSPIDGCFYAIPQAADHVMKLDPKTDTVSFIGPAWEGRNLWYGGLVGNDGAVYGVNQNARGVLRIDPKMQTATMHGSFPEGGHKWHGGVKAPCGTIYGIPAHSGTVLKIVPGPEPFITTIGGPLRSGEHRNGDGKYKYLGGAVGIDGNVYFFPSDADYVLQVNTRTDVVREVGPNLRNHERIHNNKWQNGFASKSCLYGIPLKGETIVRIKPKSIEEGGGEPNAEVDVTTVGGPYCGLNKWEGGVMDKNGDMWCMPLNYGMVLRMKSL